MQRFPPCWRSLGALAAACLLLGARSADPGPERALVRADDVRPLGPGAPRAVRVLPPAGSSWPAALREELEARVLAEWPANRAYGVVYATLGVWLDHPLVVRALNGVAEVPVLATDRLPIRGRLEPVARRPGPRRVVLLIDASSSANARTPFSDGSGTVEMLPVLEAELRAAEHLVERLEGSGVELGVLAFGEGTWPLVAPGASLELVRERLAGFRREHPRGEGRTDTVCALWSARQWLDEAGSEIVLLTDGDLPHSGRFLDCSRSRAEARARCEERRNRSPCPGSRRVASGSGRADAFQMAEFGRRFGRRLRVSPLVFEADRSARAYRKLALQTGGAFVQVSSLEAAAAALPSLLAGGVRAVFARHLGTGERSADLLGADGRSFAGSLRLVPGANDVELRVEGERGPAAHFRFRVYSAGESLRGYLAELRRGNDALARRAESLHSAAPPAAPASRKLEVATEP
jgi:hypothetical protein